MSTVLKALVVQLVAHLETVFLTRELKIIKSINIGLTLNKYLGGYLRKAKRRGQEINTGK